MLKVSERIFETLEVYNIFTAILFFVSVSVFDTLPLFNTEVPILKDFWIFDDQSGFVIEYNILGRFLGVNRIPKKISSVLY